MQYILSLPFWPFPQSESLWGFQLVTCKNDFLHLPRLTFSFSQSPSLPIPPPPLSSPKSLMSGKMCIVLNSSCATSWVFAVQHHNHSHHNILTVVKYHRQHPQFVYDFLNVRKTTSWIQDSSIVSVLRTLPVRSAHFLLACLSAPSATFAWNFCFLNDATLRLTAELAEGETTCISWGAAWRSQYVRDSWYSEVPRSFVSARLSLLHNRKTTFSSLDHPLASHHSHHHYQQQKSLKPLCTKLSRIKPSRVFYKIINPI